MTQVPGCSQIWTRSQHWPFPRRIWLLDVPLICFVALIGWRFEPPVYSGLNQPLIKRTAASEARDAREEAHASTGDCGQLANDERRA